MSKIASKLHKVLAVLMLATTLSFAMPSLHAQAEATSEPTPPLAPGERGGTRLERTWLRQQRTYNRLSFMFDHAQRRIDRAQELIDQATANGKDTAGLQAALDGYAAAVKSARPAFESAKGILASHKGFDAQGRVTEAELAEDTVRNMGEQLREIRDVLLNPARALGDALRAFREANRPN